MCLSVYAQDPFLSGQNWQPQVRALSKWQARTGKECGHHDPKECSKGARNDDPVTQHGWPRGPR